MFVTRHFEDSIPQNWDGPDAQYCTYLWERESTSEASDVNSDADENSDVSGGTDVNSDVGVKAEHR